MEDSYNIRLPCACCHRSLPSILYSPLQFYLDDPTRCVNDQPPLHQCCHHCIANQISRSKHRTVYPCGRCYTLWPPCHFSSDEGKISEMENICRGCQLSASTSTITTPSPFECLYCYQISNTKLLVCARCKHASYCSKECQRAHWKRGHKEKCAAMADRNGSAASKQKTRTTKSNDMHESDEETGEDDDEEDEELESDAFGVDDVNEWGLTNDEMNDLLSQGVKPWDDDAMDVLDVLYGREDISASEQFHCHQRFISKKDKKRHRQHLITPPGGSSVDGNDHIDIDPSDSPIDIVVVGGFGPLGFYDDIYIAALRTAFAKSSATLTVKYIDFHRKRNISALQDRLTSNHPPSSLIVLGDENKFSRFHQIEDTVRAFVAAGGLLLMQGEREAAKFLCRVFNKQWKMEEYSRMDHKKNSHFPNELLGTLPASYNVKACMLANIPDSECVYFSQLSPESNHFLCPLAAACYGMGWIIFVGDVNAESTTIAIIHQVMTNARYQVSDSFSSAAASSASENGKVEVKETISSSSSSSSVHSSSSTRVASPLSAAETKNVEQIIVCTRCGGSFQFSLSERLWYQSMNFQPPKKCKACRKQRHNRGGRSQ